MPDDNFSPQESIPLFEQRSNELVTFLNSLIEDTQFSFERGIEITGSTIDNYRNLQAQLEQFHNEQWLTNHYNEIKAKYPDLNYDTFMEGIVREIDDLRIKVEIADKQYCNNIAIVEFTVVGINEGIAHEWINVILEKVKDLNGEYQEIEAKPLQSESFKIKCKVVFKN